VASGLHAHIFARYAIATAVAALLPALVWAAQVEIRLEGLEKTLEENVRASLELQNYVGREVSAAQVRRIFRRSEPQLRRALEPFGYYNPEISSDLSRDKDVFRATFRVQPGVPTTIRQRQVRVLGEGADEPEVRSAIEAFRPSVGERLVHGTYESSKEQIESALLSLGYLDMKALSHRVEVTRQQNSADINLQYESGGRYRFGDVSFSGGQFPEHILQRFVPWEPDEYYSTDELLVLQQRLVQSEYFSTVAVQPNLQAKADGRVPVDVAVVPGKRNAYQASIFYGTDSGPGISFSYDRRWVNSKGDKLGVQMEFSQRLEAVALTYRMPLVGRNNRTRSYGVRFRDETTDTSQSRNVRLSATESREWRGFVLAYGLHFVTGNFEVGSEQGDSNLLYPEVSLTRKETDDPLFTRRGYSLSLAVRGGAEALLSSTRFLQTRADAKWIRGVSDNQRIILRGSLGWTTVDDFNELPPELRFFAGGDRSVRGYDYQSIGPENALGEVTGGRNLAVASAEYEYYFIENWGVAAFVDTGNAFNGTHMDLRTGAGIGVRWRSPVGLVRVDVAQPVGARTRDAIRFHVMIGPDL
jgi:translocation and assembly module TamA